MYTYIITQPFDYYDESLTNHSVNMTGQYVAPKYAHCNTQHFAIAVFCLALMELEGSLLQFMHVHLKSWFKQVKTMHFINIPFDLNMGDRTKLNKHTEKVKRKTQQLAK